MTMTLPIQAILEAELRYGNRIFSVRESLHQCKLLVVLEKPFLTRPPLAMNVTFHEVTADCWKAEYRCKGGEQVLACRAGQSATTEDHYAS
jgi:hypothetical protein